MAADDSAHPTQATRPTRPDGFDLPAGLDASIAGMAGSPGGLDVLACSGDVGEHAERLRAWAVEGLGLLALKLDGQANAAASCGDAAFSAQGCAAQEVILHLG